MGKVMIKHEGKYWLRGAGFTKSINVLYLIHYFCREKAGLAIYITSLKINTIHLINIPDISISNWYNNMSLLFPALNRK